MKTTPINTILLVALILVSCVPAGKSVPLETPVSTSTTTPMPKPTLTTTAAPTSTTVTTPKPTSTATSAPIPNSFLGYWIQTKLPDNPFGMMICGNFQKVEFFEDGTFIETSDNSGIYDDLPPMDQTAQGTYTILNEKEVEIKYSDDNVTVWKYVFSGDSLTMSSPWQGEYLPCYFTKSSK